MKDTFERLSSYGACGHERERVSRIIFQLPRLLAPNTREVSDSIVDGQNHKFANCLCWSEGDRLPLRSIRRRNLGNPCVLLALPPVSAARKALAL